MIKFEFGKFPNPLRLLRNPRGGDEESERLRALKIPSPGESPGFSRRKARADSAPSRDPRAFLLAKPARRA